MDIDERQAKITEVVWSRKKIKALTLAKMFGVSAETIRKDLIDLEQQGRIVKVHGGAQAPNNARESAYERRRSINTAAKRAVAAAALAEITEDSVIFLDYGTTTFALAEALLRYTRPLTVYTNSMPIMQTLAANDNIEVVVLGGVLRTNERSLWGPIASDTLDRLHFDQGFFGCAGVHPEAGITNPHAFEAAVSRKALLRSATAVVVTDASKHNTIAVNKVADLDEIDLLITTSQIDPALTTALDAADVEVVVAQEDTDGIP
ncbi:DeoR/GlpR family DNA-binding transcription regulator [Enemella sp. A6]|uniref:DeoR/GlpR family DNA-binding transcription regulator n=1 Tax=Enemella sp. A6 TaxID=3440152 RepID=UPI003EB86A0E